MFKNSGIIYIATGPNEKYIREFKKSYNSLRNYYNGKVSLITNMDVEISGVNIIKVKNEQADRQTQLLNKPRYLPLSPYDKTIFLDTDTIILDGFPELFRLLDHFDFCATIGPMDFNWPSIDEEKLVGYMPYNTGVLGFSSNQHCKNVFLDWFRIYEKYLQKKLPNNFSDQTPFNEAVLKNKAFVCTLPNNYNLRTVFSGHLVKNKVKIVHDRNLSEEFIERINIDLNRRTISK